MVTRCWCWWSSRRRGRDAERFHEVELQLIAFRAVDQDLIVSRQLRSSAALVLAGDTTTLDALKPVRVDRCRLASHVARDLRHSSNFASRVPRPRGCLPRQVPDPPELVRPVALRLARAL
jgi:hypothetical protein